MPELRSIILAAGKGTRMKSDVPKVLHPVLGRPMIDYVLDVAASAGSLKNVVILGHGFEQIKTHVGTRGIAVRQKRLWGTADAVRSAESQLRGFKGDVLVLCGDTPLLNRQTIRNLIRRHRSSKAACTVMTADVPCPAGYGRIIRSSDGKNVLAIREDKDLNDEQRSISEINVGLYVFNSAALWAALKKIKLNSKKKEFYLTDIAAILAGEGQPVSGFMIDNPYEGLGINTREDLALAESVMRREILKKVMRDGVTIIDPTTTFIGHNVKIGRDTVLKPFTHIENDVTIGKRCVIGPFARLRPGTKLANEVEVGNFTEVSRTTVGSKTFMKHFSFLGDARVGANVNIGAGTITANFDGKNKHVTKISDGAFIGSDSVLVAPVAIGKNAVVGAGSVVTAGRNVPSGALVMGVPARRVQRRVK